MSQPKKSTISNIFLIITICFAYSIVFGLLFIFVHNSNGSIGNTLGIVFGATALGFITTLLYYRMNVSDIDKQKIKTIMTTNAASYMVLLFTIISISINPDLVTIFENTIGIWFLSIMGKDSFVNSIFHSPTFSQMGENSSTDSELINYNFLLTQLNHSNIDNFIQYFSQNQSTDDELKFPFDFSPKFNSDQNTRSGQLMELKRLITTKRSVGYFVWVYLTSIISQMISMIAVTMHN
jgi:hypothetical protein